MYKRQVQRLLEAGTPYVIRQKVPLTGSTTFEDAVFGSITIENKEIEDQVLLKADGYPTYNFANVIDDPLMHITHVAVSYTPLDVYTRQFLSMMMNFRNFGLSARRRSCVFPC